MTTVNNKTVSVPVPDTVGETKAPSYTTAGSATIDLFFGGLVRGAPAEKIHEQLAKAWIESPDNSVRLLMHARDCRGGKGEKQVVLDGLAWLRRHKPQTYSANLRTFLDLGYYRDLLAMAKALHQDRDNFVAAPLSESGQELLELEIFAKDLMADWAKFKAESSAAAADTDVDVMEVDTDKSVLGKRKRGQVALSLAAKWAPNDQKTCHWNKGENGALGRRLRKLCFPGSRTGSKDYRQMLTALREHLKIVERAMSLQQWGSIDFGAVPSRAHNTYKKAFGRHDQERYSEYLSDVKTGKKKINAGQVDVHELVRQCYGSGDEDATVEAQWKAKMDKISAAVADADNTCNLDRCLAVCDVSGSMSGTPMDVCIALGLVTSLMARGPFHRKVLTFSTDPTWESIRGDSLHEMVSNLQQAPWGMSTDLIKAMRLILNTAVRNRVSADDMPQTLFIFSDMQFDSACSQDAADFAETTLQRVKREFRQAGYQAPKVVFWNLRGDTKDFPAAMGEDDVTLMSGFSADLLKLFLGEPIKSQDELIQKALQPYTAVIAEEER